MTADPKLRSIIARIAQGSPGETAAALSALDRLLPASLTLADVISIGLHYARQDGITSTLPEELRRLQDSLSQSERRASQQQRRADSLLRCLQEVISDLETLRADTRPQKD